jgi:hypothetical protein
MHYQLYATALNMIHERVASVPFFFFVLIVGWEFTPLPPSLVDCGYLLYGMK